MAISIGLYRDSNGDLKGKNPLGQAGANGLATWPNSFTYAGAFRVPESISGSSQGTNYSNGLIGPSITSGNMYVSLHATTDMGVCEVQIPTPSLSNDVSALPIATEVQGRLDLFATPDGNPEQNDRVAALYGYNGDLLYSLIQFYDADGGNTQFFGKATGAADFSTATLQNLRDVNGRFKAAGWISEVPPEWQAELGYSHVMGNASNWAIIGRSSVGPTMYGFDIADLVSGTGIIPTEPFMSYALTEGQQLQQQINPAWDLSNTTGENDCWTHQSRAGFGFIIPNTRTYAVFGSSGGHNSSIGYKITQDNGNLCAGHCPYVAADWGYYHWFFDLDDMIAVKNGLKQPYEIAPYSYGPIDIPLGKNRGAEMELNLRGGMFDAANNRLYLSVGGADNSQGAYSSTPLIFTFDLA